ncbi:MAG: ABC transporter substrate-binding protein [Firmicutes bacterium]|nr:ABC transporter substrate-binding protein [Bacillota bacterium]
MRGRWWPWLLLVLALLPALLIPKRRSVNDIAPSDTLTEAIFANPRTLDPALATSINEWAIDANLFQPLFQETTSGVLKRQLVSKVVVAGHTLKLWIKPEPLVGGGHLTAVTVAGALARPLWPSVGSKTARTLLASVVGSQAVVEGKTPFLAGVATRGRQEVVIHLTTAVTRAFLADLANPALSIVPASDMLRGGTNWQFTNLFGTGGYRLTNWVPNGELTFTRTGAFGPKDVEVTVYPSLVQAVQSFANGAVDAVPITADQLTKVPKALQKDVKAFAVPGNLSLYYRTGTGAVYRYPTLSIAAWVRTSFRGIIPSSGGHWPARLPVGGHMTIAVNRDLPEAVALAQTLRELKPHQITVKQVSLSALTSMARLGQIDAYIGQADLFTGPSRAIPLAPLRSLWLISPQLRGAAVYANGSLNWHRLRIVP